VNGFESGERRERTIGLWALRCFSSALFTMNATSDWYSRSLV
jgi:hypothetical protein